MAQSTAFLDEYEGSQDGGGSIVQQAVSVAENAQHPSRLLWFPTFIYALLHVGCLGVLYTGVSASAVAILLGAYALRAIGVSLVYHRYFAHRTFRTSRAAQFVLGIYGTMTVLGGLLWWAQTHRDHHQHTDTAEDIHSPRYKGFIYSHCGWFLYDEHRKVDLSKVRDLARFPELLWLERWGNGLKLLYIALCYWSLGVVGVVWGFFLPTVITIQMVHWIQSVSHTYGGYRSFPIPDDSRNHWLFGVVSFGEGFHHNHHCFPHSARLGLRWWEIDLGYHMLCAMAWLGLIWDVRVPSRTAVSGHGAKFDRCIGLARAEYDYLAKEIEHTLDGSAVASSVHPEITALRERLVALITTQAARSRETLIRGLTFSQRERSELCAALLAEVATTITSEPASAQRRNTESFIRCRLAPLPDNTWRNRAATFR